MKSLNEIIKQTPVFLNNWNEKIGVISDFENIYLSKAEYESEITHDINKDYWKEKKSKMKDAIEKWKDINILFASYGQDNYSGDAFVLFEKEGKLFEVNAGHCSCCGLEGQWDEEEKSEVNLQELENRLVNGTFGIDDYSGNEFNKELKEFLGI